MKKFKVTPHAKSLNDPELDPLLGEHNLLKLAFVDYTHLPLGLLAAALMVGNSVLVERSTSAMENIVFVFMAMSAMAFHPSFAAWCRYHPQQKKLQHARNRLIAKGLFPLLFGSLFLYSTLPLGTPVIALGFALLLLMVAYAYPLGGRGKALREIRFFQTLTPALLFGGLMLVSALAPNANRPLWGIGAAGAVFVASFVAFLAMPKPQQPLKT